MSQSPSLSFGPAWMRPELTKNASQESTRSNSQVWTAKQPQSISQRSSDGQSLRPNHIYTADQLMEILNQIQNEFQKEGLEETFRQSDPIRQLVHQIQLDRQIQQQYQQQPSSHSSKDDSRVGFEVTKQLNDLNSWSKKEKTGIDIAGIINNVTRSQSPFVSKPSLLNDGRSYSSLKPSSSHLSFNNSVNHESSRPFSSHFQQPQQQSDLIPGGLVKWNYLDPNGVQQGPFTGDEMNTWRLQGYLTDDLRIKREEESTFYLLKDYLNSIGNPKDPFLTPLPNLSAPTPTPIPSAGSLYQPFSSLNFEQQTLPGLFGQESPSFNSFLTHQPQPQLPNISNNWSSTNLASQQPSGRSSPWVTQSNLSLANDVIPTTDFRINSSAHSQSPFLTNNSIFLDQSSNYNGLNGYNNGIASNSSLPVANDDELFNQIHSQVLNNVLKEDITINSNIAKEESSYEAEKPVVAPEQQKGVAQEVAKAQVEKNVEQAKPKKEILKRQSHQQAASSPSQVHSQDSQAAQTQAHKIITETAKPEPKKSTSSSQLAPWAKKATTPSTPTLTLDQIQQMEAEEMKKQAKLKQEKDKSVAAQLLADAEKSILNDGRITNALPSGASWGSSVQAKPPTKTLLDIQREEAELEAAKAASLASLAKANVASTSPIVNPALPSKNSFASIASTTNTTGSAWTTVTRKTIAKPTPAPTKITSTTAKITPEVLRSVSAAAPAPTSATSTTSSSSSKVSPRQEFLGWCRSTIKLNKGVNKDDVLQILLMLPATGGESNEIIADTIYSNSSVMDGRRFASEFLKRRKAVEDQVTDGLSWSEALNINPEDEDDGWDFQVVGKKNKRRN